MDSKNIDTGNSGSHVRSLPKRYLRNSLSVGLVLTSLVAAGACGQQSWIDDDEEVEHSSNALSDSDCAAGNGCASPTWTYAVTPQWPSDWGKSTYCDGRKCKKGEGDCDSDSECEAGLSCVANRGAFVGLPSDYEICWPTDHVCKQLGPCSDGEGDCDSFPGEQGPRQCVENTVCQEEGTVDRCRARTPEDLNSYLAGVTVTAPGMGAAVFDIDGMFAIGVRGVRKSGESALIQKSDRFHLGSNTKAMTATLAAVLDSKGLIDWDKIDNWHSKLAAYAGGVSLFNVLGHRAGFPSNISSSQTAATIAARHQYTTTAWTTTPGGTPGLYLYSNTGYIVAADNMEHQTGVRYEDMMKTYVWGPLGMSSCGWGSPPSIWGHDRVLMPAPGGLLIPTWVPTQNDNPPIYDSAGAAHCKLEDYGKFLREHLRGPSDRSALLPQSYYDRMHQDSLAGLGHYQAGWIVGSYDGVYALYHDGSNTHNYVTTVVVPERNIAVVVFANFAGDGLANIPAQLATVREALLVRYRP
jgi:D-alanyl-D-alanine carboxypeptidase